MSPLTFPNIDPIIVSLGPLHFRWYGLMYAIGFMACYTLVKKQIKEHSYTPLAEHYENLNLLLILSVVLGGRLGYVFFYNFTYYAAHPLEIPAVWTGGMSFHGACLLVLVTGGFFCWKNKLHFWKVADIYVATIPIGLGLGRIGNFINGELFGRKTDLPWGMVFPGGGAFPRHPSQLYEALLEGVVLFTLLWSVRNKPWRSQKGWPHGSIVALFLIGYGCLRIIVETFREPDQHIGYILNLFTMGQLLSGSMVLAGLLIWKTRLTKNPPL